MMFRKQSIVFCALLIVYSECWSLTSPYLSKKQVRAKARKVITTELCGPIQEINLSGSGNATSQLVVLSASDKRICKLRVTAPKKFIVKMQFMMDFSLFNDHYKPCKISIFIGNEFVVPAWTIDPCSDTTFEDNLLPSEFTIAWKPLSGSYFLFNKNILLNTVGTGKVCKDEKSYFSCNEINEKFYWDSSKVCVDSSLLCDGNINCPDTNKDEYFCELASYFDDSLNKAHIPDLPEYDYKVTTVTSYKKQLGWGGGLVIFILLCIKLCVRCARRQEVLPKSEPEAHRIRTTETEAAAAHVVSQDQTTGPTVVLIVHQPDEESNLKEEINPNPPKYEDLEQPPPYSSLLL